MWRLLRVPWTARRCSQSILKISPEVHWKDWCWSWNSYFGHLVRRADSFEKTLMLGKIKGKREGDNRGWEDEMTEASPTQWTWVWVNSGSWWWTGRPGVLWFMGSQRVGLDRATEPNWTEQLIDILSGSPFPLRMRKTIMIFWTQYYVKKCYKEWYLCIFEEEK